MNNLQKIASQISGYEPTNDFTSAKNDYYYDLKTEQEQVEFLIEFSLNVNDVEKITDVEARKINSFLQDDADMSQNDRYHAFMKL